MECWNDDCPVDCHAVWFGNLAGVPDWRRVILPNLWRYATYGAAAIALSAVLAAGWYRHKASGLESSLALAQAQAAASQALADDYEARAEKARVDLAAAEKARKAAESARDRKWERVRQAEPEWSETPVPQSVVDALNVK
jgi:hypothetical protein